MKCYARWRELENGGLCVRDQTILQFGESWDLLASLVLFNPGSALPNRDAVATEFLSSRGLPYFIGAADGQQYYEFNLDPLMRSVLKAAAEVFSDGAIKIYNLFNIKNQNSGEAVGNFESQVANPLIYTRADEVRYLSAPVVFACGLMASGNPALERQLLFHVEQAPKHQMFGLLKTSHKCFTIEPIGVSSVLNTYHPSFTFKYGNRTDFRGLKT